MQRRRHGNYRNNMDIHVVHNPYTVTSQIIFFFIHLRHYPLYDTVKNNFIKDDIEHTSQTDFLHQSRFVAELVRFSHSLSTQ